MPNNELESLIAGYRIQQPSLDTQLPSFAPAPGVSIEDYQKIVDSGKSWFSEDLTSDYGGQEAVYFRTPEQVEMEQEFYQGIPEKIGAGVLRTVNKFASEILKMPGYAAGLTQAAFTDASLAESLDNWWVNGLQEWENYANEELLKVYVPDSVRYGSLWDNLSSASFYATEGADGVGFLASMIVPGNALKLLKLGQRGVNLYNAGNSYLRTVKGLSKGLTKTGALRYAAQGEKLGMRAARNFDDFTAATVNATLEASAEAKESFDNSLDSIVSNYMEANNIEDTSQIDQNTMMGLREQAGQIAANVFKFNMAILMVPNLMDQRALFGAFDSRKSTLGKMFNEQGILQDFSAKTLKQKSLGYLGALGKGILKEGFFEEGMQFTGAEYFKDQAMLPEDEQNKTYYQKLGGLVDSYIENLGSVDMQKAIALGGILGGGMSVVGQVKDDRYQSKYGSILHAQLKNNLIDRVKGVADIFEKDDTGKIKFDKGKPVINEQKFQDLLSQPENKMMLNKLADIAALSGDKEDYNLIQSILDYNYFQPFFEQGKEGIQILKNHITGELSKSELEKQDVEELLGLTGSATQAQRMSNLLQRVDEYYELYDNVDNRHEFDMPSLQGGSKTDRATFSQLIRNKKLEKVVLNSELKKVTNSLNQQVYSIVSKNLVNPEDPTTPAELSESDKKELELLYGKEKQYKEQLKNLLEDEKALYDKEAIQEEYEKYLADKSKKEAEQKQDQIPDSEIIDKFSKDLANAGYKMDREHLLDPDTKSKLSPEELEKFKGDDVSFYFELNGREYEAFSYRDPVTNKTRRVYRDAKSKEVKDFNIDFLKKNRNIRIINKQEALAKKKLEKLKRSKEAKLKAFLTINDRLTQNLSENNSVLQDAYVKRAEIKTQIEFYEKWIDEITNKAGRATNGKAQEKKQLQAEIKRLEALLEEVDSQIRDLNAIYNSLIQQYDLLSQIKEDFELYKENGVFKTEQDNILFDQFTKSIKDEINKELESLIEEEQNLIESLKTANEAVMEAEKQLNNAIDLRTEVQLILEDLNRIKDINDIIEALMTSDFNSQTDKDGSPNRLQLLANKFKPLRLIFNSIEKLRNNTITDEEYIRLIQITNNLLEDESGNIFSGLVNVIKSESRESNKILLNPEVQFYIENHYFYPDRMLDKIVNHKQRLLDSATKYYFDLSEQQIAQMSSRDMRLLELSDRENNLQTLMNSLYVQYRNQINKKIGNVNYNNEAPSGQAPTVYEEDELKINTLGFLTSQVFRNIGVDLNYNKEGYTIYPDNNNGLPELNTNDENYRRLRTFMDNNPDLASKYNARFFIARRDAEGNSNVILGEGQTSDEILGLYSAIPLEPGDLSIGFYLENEKGEVAKETYNNETKLVLGFIPKSITDSKGNLRINNATAVSIITGGFNIKGRTKFINDYEFKKQNDSYIFSATNFKNNTDVVVTVKDGKATVEAAHDAYVEGTTALQLTDEESEALADALSKNTAYSLSRAGKLIQSLLKNSKVKYQKNINLVREKTSFVEDAGVFETYGSITIEELISKAKESLSGDKGLYKTQIIDYLVNHIETENKKAYSGITGITNGVPIVQYETDENGVALKNRPVKNKITKSFPISFEKGKMKGGDIVIADFSDASTSEFTPGKVLLRLDKTGEMTSLTQRNLTDSEILTAIYIMSRADEGNVNAPEFGEKNFMVIKDGSNNKQIKSYFLLPFNKENNVSAITSLLYWGKQTDEKYIDAQGNEIPVASDKVSEIFYHNGEIHFKKRIEDGTFLQTSIDIMNIRKALLSANPLQNPLLQDLVTYLADKRLNVNKQLLTENASSGIYFHPEVKRTADGYVLNYKSYDSYRKFLADSVLTTSVPTDNNFPKFANKMITFKRAGTKDSLGIQISDTFKKPSEPRPKAQPVTRKKSQTTPEDKKGGESTSGLDPSKMSSEGKKLLAEAANVSKFNKTAFKDLPDGMYTIEETEYDTDGESIKGRIINTFIKRNGKYETSGLSNSYSQEDLAIFEDAKTMSLKSFIGGNKNFTFSEYKPLAGSKEEEVANELSKPTSLEEAAKQAVEKQKSPTTSTTSRTSTSRAPRGSAFGVADNLTEQDVISTQEVNCTSKPKT